MRVETRGSAGMAEHAFDYRIPDFAALRRTEFSRLDEGTHAYLDYTGAGLYAASQIDAHHQRLREDVLGNPHSENPTSLESTARMARARSRVLEFLHADPAVYDAIFTMNTSAALRIADVLGVSMKTVQRDWMLARAWLRKEIAGDLTTGDLRS